MAIKKIQKVFIANRGEIAHRIARTTRKLGILSIGMAAKGDSTASHSQTCDQFVWVEGCSSPTDAFLSATKIAEAARKAGADAIHPGYGFLSESAELAIACHSHGLTFIGPSPEALTLFGDKSETKKVAKQLSLPVLDTIAIDVSSTQFASQLKEIEQSSNFPLLIKSRAGGGGRGMRLVQNSEQLKEACLSAAREAEKFFGDGSLLIEPYLSSIKHIEIQIAGDKNGEVFHLFERECSAQRNYQKILEEAPASSLSNTLKAKLFDSATTLCKHVLYQGLGTVEFLVTDAEEYFFTEVNPRLQVEHPVTEQILGIDLVALQLHIAEGAPLTSFSQDLLSLTPRGHAIEARINAESSLDFTPRTGILTDCSFPKSQADIRIESGVETNSEVSPYFDSLIAKLIVTRSNRMQATEELKRALFDSSITGVETNIPFLLRVLERPEWDSGTYDTSLTNTVRQETPRQESLNVVHCVAAALFEMSDDRLLSHSSFDEIDSFRIIGNPAFRSEATIQATTYSLSVTKEGNTSFAIKIEEGEQTRSVYVNEVRREGDNLSFDMWDSRHLLRVTKEGSSVPHIRTLWVSGPFFSSQVSLAPPQLKKDAQREKDRLLTVPSPLPGTILKVLVTVGDAVSPNDTLLLLESMKMEHPILSRSEGVVGSVLVKEGDSVVAGQPLVTFNAE